MCSCSKDESKEEDSNEQFKLAAALRRFYHGNKGLEVSDVEKIQTYLNGTDAIKDVSPQFVENVKIAMDKYQDNILVMGILKSIVSEQNVIYTLLLQSQWNEVHFAFRWDF